MPRTPSSSPTTGESVPEHYIHTASGHFLDTDGRVLILRGVNLSGSSKAPVDHPSQQSEGFWKAAENGGESFVGRPLNLEDGSADVHLARLRGWGFNVIRYCVTWEALEHAGPRRYDYEFMDYTVNVLRKMKEYGFKVYMDPHQDVWSRFSGGSGAPYWTLPACGLEPRNFSASLSAIIHSEWPSASHPDPASLPSMIWSTNYTRLISQTVWTLFFAGRSFAPKCIIDGVNIQDWLQSHFIEAFGLLADRIRDAGDLLDETVFAWDSLNEPGEGFLGLENLNEIPKHQALKKGPTPTPIQGLRLGMGTAQTVENWNFGAMGPSKAGTATIDPAGRSVWADENNEVKVNTSSVYARVNERWGWKRDPGWELGTCIWAQHGVWDPVSGNALIPDYFLYVKPDPLDCEKVPGAKVDFVATYWRPFWRDYAKRIREAHPEAIFFIQPPVFVQPPSMESDDLQGRAAYSAHYYDGLTLMTRHWNWFNADALGLLRGKYSTTIGAAKLGYPAIRASLREQLGILKEDSLTILGPYPTLIGEIGVPMEMDKKRAYGYTDGGKHKGDFGQQTKALDASLNAADGTNLLSYTMWTYCPDNTHQWGDGWNLEDLSIWSADDLRPKRPHMAASSSYFNTSSSNAQLLNNRSRSSSLSSGPDAAPQKPQATFTSSTPPILTPPVNDSVDSVGSGVTLGNEYQLRSRAHNNVRFTDGLNDRNDGPKPIPTMESEASLAFPATRSNLPYRPPSNPFAFLTDGARAIAAFARPYPQAVVGRPKCVEFDLHRAEFKFTVIVNGSDASERKYDSESSDKGPKCTEIFLPLVQFASEKYIHLLEDDNHHPALGSMPVSTATIDEDVQKRRQEGTSSTPSSSLTLPPSQTHVSPLISQDAYAIIVEATCGTWSLDFQNQLLIWSYPIPASMDRDVEYSIHIKRKGGAIPAIANGTITRPVERLGDMELAANVSRETLDECCKGWGGCLLM